MKPVILVGGGLAGLSCATFLHRKGIPFLVLEAADAAGGRVRTDIVEGFRLDRGFQVLLPAYPTARELFDYKALDLRPFHPGALVRRRGSFAQVGDPRRRLGTLPATVFARVGSIGDKLRILKLERFLERYVDAPGTTAAGALRAAGFSETMLERFFRPFLGGIFLERELETDASFLAFVWSLFSRCEASLPARGMQELPRQLVNGLPAEAVRVGVRVQSVDGTSVTLEGGERLEASSVVVATDGTSAERLLGRPSSESSGAVSWNAVTCLYFAADKVPLEGPWLLLNGEGGAARPMKSITPGTAGSASGSASDAVGPPSGAINNLCFPSQVSPLYAPTGQQLVSVSVLGENADEQAVRAELVRWFGERTKAWRPLSTYRIREALPRDTPARRDLARRVEGAPWVCGDHMSMPSIEGALASGKRVAEGIAAELLPGSSSGSLPEPLLGAS